MYMKDNKTCPLPPKGNEKPWERHLLHIITIILIIAGLYNIFFSELFFGILILLALAILYLPGFFTGNRICVIPTEIRILILVVVFFELVVGDALSAYSYIPLYDKFMHTLIPAILGLMGMMFIYTAYAYGYLKASLKMMFILIILVVMGLGAMLEMSEYFYDHVLYPIIGVYLPTGLTQGSMLETPLADTMNDLLTDLLGGIFGAALGVWFIRKAEKSGDHHLFDEIAGLEGIKNDKNN